ncbi:uncharacterized protein LOC131328360 [Rhododendron vialii]|uniref:uncharacterized protein LOC131328360 n=1 Tax=Rhododendron vialii TaxID=182163 RepID=UPI002660182B|nr:uncharacterized protein LOC131328360 [Rhododendron vialii]
MPPLPTLLPSPIERSIPILGESPKKTSKETLEEEEKDKGKNNGSVPYPQIIPTPAPYPNRLKASAKPNYNVELHELFNQYKNPGSPSIAVTIGGKRIEQALLDLGASVNLLPYSVYQELGLGEMKPTRVTLQLADRSVRVPRGVVEYVLVQIDQFVYPPRRMQLSTVEMDFSI